MLKSRSLNPTGGERLLLAPVALHLDDPGVGFQFGQGENLVAGLCDAVFHAQPVEQGGQGLLLAGGGFDKGPNEMGSNRRPVHSYRC